MEAGDWRNPGGGAESSRIRTGRGRKKVINRLLTLLSTHYQQSYQHLGGKTLPPIIRQFT